MEHNNRMNRIVPLSGHFRLGMRWVRERMTDTKPKRIFVSSTISDLLPFRDVAKKVIEWSGCEAELVGPLAGLSESEVIAECQRLVSTCDLCVLIAGKRSGGRIDSHSFTSREIARADKAGIPVLAFLVEVSSAARPEFLPEVQQEEAEWVARFRHRQNVERPRADVVHIGDTAIKEFSLMLRERFHHIRET